MISNAVDLLVQISTRYEVRRVITLSNVSMVLKNGDVYSEPIYRYKEESFIVEPYWENIRELK